MKAARPLALALAITLFAASVSAQQLESAKLTAALPDAPVMGVASTSDNVAPAGNALIRTATVTTPEQRRFFDKQQMIALYVHAGVRTADTIVTCHKIANGASEMWIPLQSCGGIAAWQAASVGVTLGIGYLFYKTGHHKLERITPWVGTTASAAGLAKSVFNIH